MRDLLFMSGVMRNLRIDTGSLRGYVEPTFFVVKHI